MFNRLLRNKHVKDLSECLLTTFHAGFKDSYLSRVKTEWGKIHTLIPHSSCTSQSSSLRDSWSPTRFEKNETLRPSDLSFYRAVIKLWTRQWYVKCALCTTIFFIFIYETWVIKYLFFLLPENPFSMSVLFGSHWQGFSAYKKGIHFYYYSMIYIYKCNFNKAGNSLMNNARQNISRVRPYVTHEQDINIWLAIQGPEQRPCIQMSIGMCI